MKAEKLNQRFQVIKIPETALFINLTSNLEQRMISFIEVMEFIDMIMQETGYAYKRINNIRTENLKFICAFSKFINQDEGILPVNSKSKRTSDSQESELKCKASLKFKLNKSNYKPEDKQGLIYNLISKRCQHIHLPPNVSILFY